MTIQDIYDALASGELRQHSLFADGLAVEDYPKVNAAIEAGLVNLYGRFPLKFRQLTLVMSEHITHYMLDVHHAVTDPTPGYDKYIDDSVYTPFTGDLLKVMYVLDEVGCPMPLNDQESCHSVFTPTVNSLIVNQPVEGDVLFVNYQARHPKVLKDTNPNTALELPESFLPVILAYVGHRLYSGSTDTVSLNKSNGLLSQYELLCSQQDMFGLTNRDDGTTNQVFGKGGWV